jgi:hypothetical protein
MLRIKSIAVAAGMLVAFSAVVQAQFSNNRGAGGGTQTTGVFGSTTLGGTSALNPGSGMSSSNQGVGQSGMGMGTGGTGGLGQGMSLNIGAPAMSQSAFVGATSQNSMNVRSLQGAQGTQGGQGMVGVNQGVGGTQGMGGATLGGRGSAAGGFTNLRNAFSQQNQQTGFNAQQAQRSRQGGTQSQSQIRIPLRLGFQPPAVAAPRFNVTFSERLAKTPSFQRVGAINVSLEGRTAILRGTVASEADRQLAASLARLEPEVLAVQNELVVGSAETTGEALPPASAAAR